MVGLWLGEINVELSYLGDLEVIPVVLLHETHYFHGLLVSVEIENVIDAVVVNHLNFVLETVKHVSQPVFTQGKAEGTLQSCECA